MCPPTHPRAIMVRLGSELERGRELESGRELAGLQRHQAYYPKTPSPLSSSLWRAESTSSSQVQSGSCSESVDFCIHYLLCHIHDNHAECAGHPWHRVRLRTCKVALQEIHPAFHSRLDGGQCGIVHCTDHHTQPLAQVCEASSRRHIIHPRVPWRGIAVGGRQHGGNLQGTSLCAQH